LPAQLRGLARARLLSLGLSAQPALLEPRRPLHLPGLQIQAEKTRDGQPGLRQSPAAVLKEY
jgi:hypothetical protein